MLPPGGTVFMLLCCGWWLLLQWVVKFPIPTTSNNASRSAKAPALPSAGQCPHAHYTAGHAHRMKHYRRAVREGEGLTLSYQSPSGGICVSDSLRDAGLHPPPPPPLSASKRQTRHLQARSPLGRDRGMKQPQKLGATSLVLALGCPLLLRTGQQKEITLWFYPKGVQSI